MTSTKTVSHLAAETFTSSLPPFQITERDIEILKLVAKHRFLNSDHIRRLLGGSPKNITNRLKLLFDHGLLGRPECQYLRFRPDGGSNYLVYEISGKGAKLIANHQSQSVACTIGQSRTVGYPYLEHTLAIADFNVALNLATRVDANIGLIDVDELVDNLPVKTHKNPKPYRLHTPITHQGARISVGVEPDYVFSLRLEKENQQAFFMVEIDRGTMPVERSNMHQTSILRKLLAYQAIWQSKIHQQQLCWHSFRVLFVTTSAERVTTMIKAVNKNVLTKGSPIFLFTDKHSLYEHDDMLAHEWLDSNNSLLSLLPAQK